MRRSRHHRWGRRNPIAAPVTSYTDGLILVGIGVVVGGLGIWLWTRSQATAAANAPPAQLQSGVDAAGNPTYEYVAPSGIGVFANQTPPALGQGASTSAPAT